MNQSLNKEPLPRKPRAKKPAVSKENISLKENVKPKTEAQREMVKAYIEGFNIVAYGSAGTGKSYVCCYLALKDLFAAEVEKIVIVRSAVQTRDIGFLPGSIDEKTLAYTIPYRAIINDLCGNGTAWEVMNKKGIIEFMTTSFVRGITLRDCVLIIDEFQNMNQEELYSVLTRAGENCRILICGDTNQCDLNKKKEESAFTWLTKIADKMPDWFEPIRFLPEDIVRSDFVKDLIIASESL